MCIQLVTSHAFLLGVPNKKISFVGIELVKLAFVCIRLPVVVVNDKFLYYYLFIMPYHYIKIIINVLLENFHFCPKKHKNQSYIATCNINNNIRILCFNRLSNILFALQLRQLLAKFDFFSYPSSES